MAITSQFVEEAGLAFRRAMTEHMRAHTEGTQVNAGTLLAADYLNRYNVLLMLLDLIPQDADEWAADLAAWRPADYAAHFQASGLRDAPLAVAAYHRAPPEARAAFDAVVAELEKASLAAATGARSRIEAGDAATLSGFCADAAERIRGLLQKTADIVDGSGPLSTADCRQARIDALFG